MSSTEDKVHRIVGCDNNDRVADVVFIHGLDGDAYSTWGAKKKNLERFWPNWLGDEVPNVGIWSLDYAASSTAWKGSAMSRIDRATNALELLRLQSIGSRPIIFVCHSLGGLLVKQMLRNAYDYGETKHKVIAEKTRGIIFFSTPHFGSQLANWITLFKIPLRSGVAILELVAHGSGLRDLNKWFKNHVAGNPMAIHVYYETKKTRGFLVVNSTSADPGITGVNPIPFGYNHIDICKPNDKNSPVYLAIKEIVINISSQAEIGIPREVIKKVLELLSCHPYGEALDIVYKHTLGYDNVNETMRPKILSIMQKEGLIEINDSEYKVIITLEGYKWINSHNST